MPPHGSICHGSPIVVPAKTRAGTGTGGGGVAQGHAAWIFPVRAKHAPLESLATVSWKHDVAPMLVSPAGRGMLTQIDGEHAPGASVNVPALGVATIPPTVQPGTAGSPTSVQW